MNNPSVSIILPYLMIGGAEKVAIALANSLADEGWAMQLVTMAKAGPLLETLSPRVALTDLDCSTYRAAVPALARHFQRTKPDIVLSTLYATGLAAIAARVLSSHKPRIFIGAHNSLRSKSTRPDNIKDKYLLLPMCRMLFPRADGFIAVSRGVADELQQLLNIEGGRVHVIHNPVVSPHLLDRATEPLDHRWLGSASTRVFATLLWVGRLVPQKGVDILLKGFALVRATRDCRLILVGDGPLRGELEALARELGIADWVDFVGVHDNPFAFMSRADLFVLSSRWEGLSNVLIEALACGCPIVSTDCNYGPSEILEGETYGLLCAVDDPASLAGKIGQALTGDDRRRSDKAWLKSRSLDFTVERSVERYAAVFRAALAAA